MSSEFTISERLSSAGKEQMFANNCLKRKLEVVGRNGFSATEHDMTFQDHDCSLRIEKRPRFSNHKNNSDDANRQDCTDHYISNVNNGDISTGNYHDGKSIGADSLLQNNLECHVPTGDEQTEEMDFECQSVDSNGCPPNLKGENISPAKGSPARELLLKHRPECQMHCIPSYCHPGGLWDVMLEVYHGL